VTPGSYYSLLYAADCLHDIRLIQHQRPATVRDVSHVSFVNASYPYTNLPWNDNNQIPFISWLKLWKRFDEGLLKWMSDVGHDLSQPENQSIEQLARSDPNRNAYMDFHRDN
jgi:hypothetical protein